MAKLFYNNQPNFVIFVLFCIQIIFFLNNLTLDAVEGIDPELRTVILNPDNPQGLPPVTSTNLETDTINLNLKNTIFCL